MKRIKKLGALLLALVMALTVLTGCGGGGGGSVSLGQVERLLEQQHVDADVSSSGALSQAVKEVASTMERLNRFDATTANLLLTQVRNYPVVMGDEARIGMGISVSKQELGSTSLEELVAACIITLDRTLASMGGYDAYVDNYYVSATTVTSTGGTVYYVIGIEAEVERPD